MKIKTTNKIQLIISGGQSGVDRAALDFSIKHNIPHKGYCPAKRWAEDGKIDPKYNLIETESSDTSIRTRKNVELADATLIIFSMQMDEGTQLTEAIAKQLKNPFYILNLDRIKKNKFIDWVEQNQISSLNIAGPRESNSPGIYISSLEFLESIRDLF